MSYTVGISTGMFMVAEAGEKPQYLSIPLKIQYSLTQGVNFAQLDLESIVEFKEPNIEENIKKVKKMGITFGIHGESYAMGGAERPISMLDSAIETEYIHAHERLILHIEGAGKIGAVYVLVHSSESTPFMRLSMHLQPTRLVDPWGRELREFLKENPDILDWAVKQDYIIEAGRGIVERSAENDKYRKVEEYRRKEGKDRQKKSKTKCTMKH